MLSLSSEQLNAWIVALLWPAARILAIISVTPLFGHRAIPARVKLGLGLMLSMAIAPGLPPLPAVAPFSYEGLLLLMQQVIIGLAIGFIMRLVFAGIELAGEVAALTMGLSFASFFDPNTSTSASVLSQWFGWLALTVFVSANLHLAVVAVMADSFQVLPITATPVGTGPFRLAATYGSQIFSIGVQLSLPIVAALLITNLALGILTKAAPQLNIFAIGFPITLAMGFVIVAMVLPYLAQPIVRVIELGIMAMRG